MCACLSASLIQLFSLAWVSGVTPGRVSQHSRLGWKRGSAAVHHFFRRREQRLLQIQIVLRSQFCTCERFTGPLAFGRSFLCWWLSALRAGLAVVQTKWLSSKVTERLIKYDTAGFSGVVLFFSPFLKNKKINVNLDFRVFKCIWAEIKGWQNTQINRFLNELILITERSIMPRYKDIRSLETFPAATTQREKTHLDLLPLPSPSSFFSLYLSRASQSHKKVKSPWSSSDERVTVGLFRETEKLWGRFHLIGRQF